MRVKFKVKFCYKDDVIDRYEEKYQQINVELKKTIIQNQELEIKLLYTSYMNFLKQQNEIYQYKNKFFKEIPMFVMSLEQFGTLHSIQDYLLNKLESKSDLDYVNIFNHYLKSIKKELSKEEGQGLNIKDIYNKIWGKQQDQFDKQIRKYDDHNEMEEQNENDENSENENIDENEAIDNHNQEMIINRIKRNQSEQIQEKQ